MDQGSRPPAQIVPLRGPRSSFKRRRADRDTDAIRNGQVAVTPVVLFCHLRGESAPFPQRWRWGTLRIGAGAPVWKPVWPKGGRDPLDLPVGTKPAGPPRGVQREELSAFCPNPRKSLVLPLDSPGGRIYVGLARESIEPLVAALEVALGDEAS